MADFVTERDFRDGLRHRAVVVEERQDARVEAQVVLAKLLRAGLLVHRWAVLLADSTLSHCTPNEVNIVTTDA